MDLSLTIFPSDRITELANSLSPADREQFMEELDDASKPFRASQLQAERAVFEFERIVRPPAGSRPEDFPEDSPLRQQMSTPGQKPKPSMGAK